MLTSPISITIDGTAHSLSRINQDNYSAVYLKKLPLEEFRLTIRHSYEGKAGNGQMERHNVDLVHTVWDSEGNSVVNQTYSVLRNPRGADTSDIVADSVGLSAFVTANAGALVGWES